MQIDINVDLGEGFNNEAKIMPFISSCNIACGGHVGNLETIQEVIKLAKVHNVKVGAHPSFPDPENFGRKIMDMDVADLYSDVRDQVRGVLAIAKIHGVKVHHIKPHGALYHLACHEQAYAKMFINLIYFDSMEVSLMGLPNCLAERLAKESGIGFIREGFADRSYHTNGELVNRSIENSVLQNNDDILNQVLSLTNGTTFTSFEKEDITLNIDSICFHGDHEGSVERIESIYNELKKRDIKIGV